ncbi:HAD family phosphatase [Marinilabiliaceae bacterium JC017]|nr:HAD family phosphatase [Marinilabiliaceae bacterium JC017]
MKRLIATDLDGTIFSREQDFHHRDLEALQALGNEGVVRVVATGRTLYSCLSVLPVDFPIDYLVFSSGAGLYDWKNKKLLETVHLGLQNTAIIAAELKKAGVEFTLHWAIPENHCFYYSMNIQKHPDFLRYLALHENYAFPLSDGLPERDYTQALAFLPDVNTYHEIASVVNDVKVVRVTSPIDGESIWMEFFNKEVSKAIGVEKVCNLERVSYDEVAVLGNDYNDLDMLTAFSHAFVVENAPDDLKRQFHTVTSVYNGALSEMVSKV